jgi:hypothetical protein
MRLSWNEIRARAARFAEEWKGASYERGQTQTFYNEFFEVFDVPRKKVAIFEEPIKGLADNKRGFMDLFWKGTLLVEQKSAGLDLSKAKRQAFDYLPGIKNDKDLPRFILLCDFQSFELIDLETRKEWRFGLYDLPKHVQAFSFIFGGVQREFKDEDPVNIKASELMGELHDALKASGHEGHDLERFLVRLVFCLFADDTGIFTPKGILTDYIDMRTSPDGTDLGPKLAQLFEVLNTHEDKRQKALDEDLKQFPYINGDLFKDRLSMPYFDSRMRAILLEACAFDWSLISPAIFGALFQSVMDKKKRRAIGAHYTNEQNIMKVIGPLFLDELKMELARLKARKDNSRDRVLADFQAKLAAINCFDPACGCGNFLVVAYRELRALENETILARASQFTGALPKVDVNQFYGIEIEEFPARIGEIAMWMMDHIMNMRLSEALGIYLPRIPLKASPKIVHGDALEINWSSVLPPDQCSYVFGNPPFLGAKIQSGAQRAQVHRIADLGKKKGTLDFVTCWFLKAGAYVNQSSLSPIGIGFVSTNSITQGEQVAELWPLLFNRYRLEITFAHRTFAWGSEARGKANVHVVIIGLEKHENVPAVKRLFDYVDIKGNPTETQVKVISPYLFDAGNLADPHLVVPEMSKPINGLPRLKTGVQMIDDGIYTFDDSEKLEFIQKEPNSEKWFRKFIGGDEYINGFYRWILYLQGISPSELSALPFVKERVKLIRLYRSASDRKSTKAMADTPTRLGVDERLSKPFLVIPNTSSETREYVPIGWLAPDVVANQKLRILSNAEVWLFGLLTSRMHMAWMRAITGRMKSDYMYSVGIVYNNFPLPDLDSAKEKKIAALADAVLDARLYHPTSTLADLYDPLTMPPNLRKAHTALDVAVDRLYRKEPFETDRARVEFLLARYEQITAPALAMAAQKPKRLKKTV